jgi:exodeoxyribonuclease V alpha subunit
MTELTLNRPAVAPVEDGINQLRPIDRQFRQFLLDRFDSGPEAALAGAIASALLDQGHSCMFLDDHCGETWDDGEGDQLILPPAGECIAALQASQAVGKPGSRKPLILDGRRLYIYKYFSFETRTAERLRTMAVTREAKIPPAVLALARKLFDEKKDLSASGGQLQAAGALLPFFMRLGIVTGGPGTGKTTVLAKMLALLSADALAAGRSFPKIRLAAPTGKAAQRMADSIRNAVLQIHDRAIAERLSALVPSTLHRLLGLHGNSPRPRYDCDNPVDADIVVVDETSMMDISLFARLVDALPEDSRLILLGDRYQLASVEAGCVMADVCEAFTPNMFPSAFAEIVNGIILRDENRIAATAGASLSPVVELKHSYRFEGDKPIGVVSRGVNAGDAERAVAALRDRQSDDDYCVLTDHPGDEVMAKLLLEGYGPLLISQTPEEALVRLEKFMVLTALNEGRFGREGINRLVYRTLGSIPSTRPVKITENSPSQRLFNGDMGVIMRMRNSDGTEVERAWFRENKDAKIESKDAKVGKKDAKGEGKNANVRAFLVGALPAHVDAFAITIHNSQGSEFDRVAIVLPERDTPLLTRELLYTAVTRARRCATLFGTEEIVRGAVARKIERHSGLGGRLK